MDDFSAGTRLNHPSSEINFSSKIRPEFKTAEGAALFQKEKEINDDRFKLDERFIDEAVKTKVKNDGERKLKERRKREFQSVRHIPNQEASETEDESESDDEKNQFTNIEAPQVSTETHFKGQFTLYLSRQMSSDVSAFYGVETN